MIPPVESTAPASHTGIPLPPPSVDPPWIHEAWAQTWGKTRFFYATLFAVLRSPRTFCEDWAHGKRSAMNPFAFYASSFALVATLEVLANRLAGVPRMLGAVPTWVVTATKYGAAALIPLLCHLFFRWWGTQRPLRTTLGAGLFAFGGPGVAIQVIRLAVIALIFVLYPPWIARLQELFPQEFGQARPSAFYFTVQFGQTFIAFAYGAFCLAGVHRVRWWRAYGALLASFVMVVGSGCVIGLGLAVLGHFGLLPAGLLPHPGAAHP